MSTFLGGKLFRYYSCCDEDHIDYVRQVIIDSKLYFNSPMQFNDPFDCKIEGLRFSEESFMSFFRQRYSFLTDEQFNESFRCNLDRYKSMCDEAINGLQNLVNEQFSVLCMSSTKDNIMMYSHYADKHQGVCLEFTLPANNRLQPEKVEYVEEFPEPPFAEEGEELRQLAVALLTTKAKFWDYENEY